MAAQDEQGRKRIVLAARKESENYRTMERGIIERTADHVRRLLSGEGSGHDWFHIERVRRTALTIAGEEEADVFVAELAALLHDVADWKFADGNHDAGPRAARESLISLRVAA